MPGAGPKEIRAGDTLIQKHADGTEVASAIGFVFATVPAIKNWSTGGGTGASVSYPVAPGAPGTGGNPVTVLPGNDGKRILNIEFWRPQRYSIAGAEPEGFFDIGHLEYRAELPPPAGMPAGKDPWCPVETLTPGPGLTPKTSSGPGVNGSLVDSSGDQPSDPARTLSMAIDVDACAAARGITLTPGAPIPFSLGAYAPRQPSGNRAKQGFIIKVG